MGSKHCPQKPDNPLSFYRWASHPPVPRHLFAERILPDVNTVLKQAQKLGPAKGPPNIGNEAEVEVLLRDEHDEELPM